MKKAKLNKTKPDAAFLGWQKDLLGGSYALYNITRKDHHMYGSTVTEGTIHKMNLKMPEQSNPNTGDVFTKPDETVNNNEINGESAGLSNDTGGQL